VLINYVTINSSAKPEGEFNKDWYYVVHPFTAQIPTSMWKTGKQTTDNWTAGYSKLIDQLVDRNQKQVMLTINSSLRDHYFVDYNGNISALVGNLTSSDNWFKLIEKYPNVKALVSISLPVYDEATGNGLIYYLVYTAFSTEMTLHPFRYIEEQFVPLKPIWSFAGTY
jgi:hypothetical protein